MGQADLQQGLHLALGGGFKDEEKCVDITKGKCEIIQTLVSPMKRRTPECSCTPPRKLADIIQSLNTDVITFCVYTYFKDIGCKELWFQTEVKDKMRYIPVHSMPQ